MKSEICIFCCSFFILTFVSDFVVGSDANSRPQRGRYGQQDFGQVNPLLPDEMDFNDVVTKQLDIDKRNGGGNKFEDKNEDHLMDKRHVETPLDDTDEADDSTDADSYIDNVRLMGKRHVETPSDERNDADDDVNYKFWKILSIIFA